MYSKSFKLYFVCFLYCNIQVHNSIAQITLSPNDLETTTEKILTVTVPQSVSDSSTLPVVNLTNKVLPTIPSFPVILPSKVILLAGENLKINVTASEKFVEFTVILLNKVSQEQNKANPSNFTLRGAKRLLLAFENEHFNVDIIALKFINDSNGNIAFENRIEDMSWNKKNGILLPDAVQNYKWISSGSKENGTQFFISFTREWMTCDEQDIQFTISPMKIWWLVDTQDELSISNGNTKASNKMFEKQEMEPQNVKSSTPDSINNNAAEAPIPTITPTSVTTSLGSSITTSIANDTKLGGNQTKSSPINTTRPIEVEILKSIQDYKFIGPQNTSFAFALENTNLVYLKACDASNIIFLCNSSNYLQNTGMNNASNQILFIWRIHFDRKFLNSTEFKTKSCNLVPEYLRTYQASNKKLFNALSGNPKTKDPSKNSALSMSQFALFEDYMTILTSLLILMRNVC